MEKSLFHEREGFPDAEQHTGDDEEDEDKGVDLLVPAHGDEHPVEDGGDENREPEEEVGRVSDKDDAHEVGEDKNEEDSGHRLDDMEEGRETNLRLIHDGDRHGEGGQIDEREPEERGVPRRGGDGRGPNKHGDDERAVCDELERGNRVFGMHHAREQQDARCDRKRPEIHFRIHLCAPREECGEEGIVRRKQENHAYRERAEGHDIDIAMESAPHRVDGGVGNRAHHAL